MGTLNDTDSIRCKVHYSPDKAARIKILALLPGKQKCTFTMGERLSLKQIGGASTAFDNQTARFPELNANFELKSGLINLLPKFHGRPGEYPIKDIKDFEVDARNPCGISRLPPTSAPDRIK
ncbi:hypothetical protein PIB30_062270 [Stylosanthes scabra]|uniref:Uncharacterized protein n=1 Tax=Stylosanthes scabra TaxID=79078 RepID=A0ABU6RL59_9FABA|nr:hypothetical protein [Stylosanthes scabra]